MRGVHAVFRHFRAFRGQKFFNQSTRFLCQRSEQRFLATLPRLAAHAVRLGGHAILRPIRLARVASRIAAAIHRPRTLRWHFLRRLDHHELPKIGRLRVEPMRLFAHRDAPSADEPVAVIVENLLERPFVKDRKSVV